MWGRVRAWLRRHLEFDSERCRQLKADNELLRLQLAAAQESYGQLLDQIELASDRRRVV